MIALLLAGCRETSVGWQLEKIAAAYDQEHPDVTHIRVEKYRTQTNLWHLIDVRRNAERDVSWIPGSISLAMFEHRPNLYTNRPLLLYCTAGWRSAEKAQELVEKGYDAKNLHAGILGWAQAGGSLMSFTGQTHRVHVFESKWNLLPDGYAPVW